MSTPIPFDCTHGAVDDICWRCTARRVGWLTAVYEWFALRLNYSYRKLRKAVLARYYLEYIRYRLRGTKRPS